MHYRPIQKKSNMMQPAKSNKYIQNKVILHALFWILSITANAYIFKISSHISLLDFYYSIFSHFCIIIGAYINTLILIPIFFQQHKYSTYGIVALLNIGLTTLLYYITFRWLVDWMMPNYFFVSEFNELETFIYALAYLSFTTLLNLSESWFELQEKNKQILITEKENIDNQLKALKSQINPHFLFNSLNVIYSEALKQSTQVPEIVIKLSDILRYVLYKSKNDTIKISDEIALINDYVELQKHRVDNGGCITFDSEYDIDHNMAPMLFLPLIENSFKHGIKGDVENTFVNISLQSNAQQSHFIIKNNQGKTSYNTNDNEKGIGLENVKNRLLLLYPNRHKFSINNENNVFSVEIKLFH